MEYELRIAQASTALSMLTWAHAFRAARPAVAQVMDEARARWAARTFTFTDEPVWSGKPIVIGSKR